MARPAGSLSLLISMLLARIDVRRKLALGLELELGPRGYLVVWAFLFSAGYAYLAFMVPLLLTIKFR